MLKEVTIQQTETGVETNINHCIYITKPCAEIISVQKIIKSREINIF